jgi:stearoyl-CoA desaturase (delta-9 desaturase)
MSLDAVKVKAEAELPRQRLPLPASVSFTRLNWPATIALILFHLGACLAFLPFFFSWSGVAVALLGLYVFGTLGINLGYHRLLTHRGFVCPKWLEYAFAILGMCCLQHTPAYWVAIHRRHHQYADAQEDPHSPLAGFIWGHFGWVIAGNGELEDKVILNRYAKDLMRDPFYAGLEDSARAVIIILALWAFFFAAGFAAEWLAGGSLDEAVQFGASIFVWGIFVRTVLVWHISWSVNSVAHLWGYRNYATGEGSRNNLLVGFISNGEGWHNNHHAHPNAAMHGHRWWELDVTYRTIRMLAALGLARDIVMPPRYTGR